MPSQITFAPALDAPLDAVVVGPETADFASKPSDGGIKLTNIEVCARLRPLEVAHSGERFFDKRGHAPSKRHTQPSMSGARSSRPSRLPGLSKLPSPRKPPVPPRIPARENNYNYADTGDGVSLSNNETAVDNSISAWDVVGDSCVSQSAASNRIQGRTNSYHLDRVYGPSATTASLYTKSVRQVVLSAMEGYHASVFAYGQTSTGKTFTMSGTKESPGIAPLAIRDCFKYVTNLNSPREYLIRVSYMEIYNEQIKDLLVTGDRHSAHQSAIRIFESKQEGVIVRGLREEVVSSPEEVFSLIAEGEARRQVGATRMNTHSSRSHCILRLLIESRVPRSRVTSSSSVASCSSSSIATESTIGGAPVRLSSLSLVDLAGSESAKLTGSAGERRKEGQYINKSLTTLGRVIFQLSEWSSRNKKTPTTTPSTPRHIPYRDSKLTRLLQPSLSGNAQIVIICNMSPQISHLEESHNTLKFAMRAKRIQQTVSVTEVTDEKTLLQSYRDEIEELKQQLKSAQDAQKLLREQQKASATDDETYELVEAIQKMERLILKARPAPSPSKKNEDNLDDDFLLSSNLDGLLIGDEESTEEDQKENNQLPNNRTEEDEHIVEELHRIQGLLGAVLKRKGGTIPDGNAVSNAPTPTRPSTLDQGFSTPTRDEEVEQLRAQLHEKEVTTSLRKADSSFLQSQLAEKDKLLREVSKILDALEKRQLELEAENTSLKQKLAKLQAEEEEMLI